MQRQKNLEENNREVATTAFKCGGTRESHTVTLGPGAPDLAGQRTPIMDLKESQQTHMDTHTRTHTHTKIKVSCNKEEATVWMLMMKKNKEELFPYALKYSKKRKSFSCSDNKTTHHFTFHAF